MLRLHCVAQHYDWGKPGADSAVARLKFLGEGRAPPTLGEAASRVDAARPFAEYWFGTHAAGPSKVHVAGEDVLLQDWLMRYPEALGTTPYSPSSALPYLFKVLSVAKALSVQAHPDKALAEHLHRTRPGDYKDDNHKPEMACALTPFEAMCGFRPASELAHNMTTVPELRAMVGEAHADALVAAAATAESDAPAFKAALKAAFHAFMSQPPETVMLHATALDHRLSTTATASGSGSTGFKTGDLSAEAVASRLLLQFPNDVGVFAPFFLNTCRLAPGEAIYLGANEPHAYLSGDCVEVMACSDNVVRAGLTPKFKDVETLTSMLTYTTGPPDVLHASIVVVITGTGLASVTSPAEHAWADSKGEALPSNKPSGASGSKIATSTPTAAASGTATAASGTPTATVEQRVEAGQVWLQPAGTSVRLTADTDITLFRTHANPYTSIKAL